MNNMSEHFGVSQKRCEHTGAPYIVIIQIITNHCFLIPLSYLEGTQEYNNLLSKPKILNNPVVLQKRVGLQSKDETLGQRTNRGDQPGQHQHCPEIFSLVKDLNYQSFFPIVSNIFFIVS